MAFETSCFRGGTAGLSRLRTAGIALGLLAITLAAYYPALNGAMQWDDAAHVTKPALRGIGGLWKIWSSVGTTQQYYPVLHSAFWLEYRMWGESVLGYHILNVFLHAGSACLFAVLLSHIKPGREASGTPGVAEWLAAAVFALHPVCVESVAWISEQKNTLSLFLYLLSALAYMRYDRGRRWGWYGAASALFGLALLSKSVTATLPAGILLMLLWRNGRLSWRSDVLPLVPWFAVGAGAGLFTAWVERTYIGAQGQAFDLGLPERGLLAGRVVWFYLGKLFWPAQLAFIYPKWHVVLTATWSLGAIGLLVLAAALYRMRGWSPAPLLALLFFVGSLFPALGFFNVYPFLFSYVADHWQYLPCLGIIALACQGGAAVVSGIAVRCVPKSVVSVSAAAAAAAAVAVLFTLTWRQSGLYRDIPALYADTLAKNPSCWMAHNNLGVYLDEAGSRAEAISHLRKAVLLKPDYAEAHNNLGNALSKEPAMKGEAAGEFEAALRIEPGMAEAHGNLGRILVGVPGRLAEGVAHLEAALKGNEENPEFADLHLDLAEALARIPERLPESLAQYEAALRFRPASVAVLNGYGAALARAGRSADAERRLREALGMGAGDPEAHNNLGIVLTARGRASEAVGEYRRALELKPDFAQAHINLALALRNSGDGSEAISEFRKALVLLPESPAVRNSLGSVLLLHGRIDEALSEFREAVRLEPGSAAYRNNLGIALTQSGRLEDAIVQLRAALERAPGFKDAHFNLGVALSAAGRGDEAAAEFLASGRPRP